VGWLSFPAVEKVLAPDRLTVLGQAAASVSAVFGTVSFAAGAYGDIKLTCPVSALPVGQAPNGLTITYYDDNAYDGSNNHCFIYADLLRSNLNNQERGWDIAYVRAANQATSGRQTMTGALTEYMNMQSSYYWVDIQLHRDAPHAACNPTLVGTYLSYVIF